MYFNSIMLSVSVHFRQETFIYSNNCCTVSSHKDVYVPPVVSHTGFPACCNTIEFQADRGVVCLPSAKMGLRYHPASPETTIFTHTWLSYFWTKLLTISWVQVTDACSLCYRSLEDGFPCSTVQTRCFSIRLSGPLCLYKWKLCYNGVTTSYTFCISDSIVRKKKINKSIVCVLDILAKSRL